MFPDMPNLEDLSKDSFQRDVHCEAIVVFLSSSKMICHCCCHLIWFHRWGNSCLFTILHDIMFVSYDRGKPFGSTLSELVLLLLLTYILLFDDCEWQKQ